MPQKSKGTPCCSRMLKQGITIDNVNTERLVSTKTDEQSHGFGILSIQSIAQKYNGTVLFTCEDLVFVTRIFLQNPSNE